MNRTPTVLIYGHDGFDPDVARNLRYLYEHLGFRTFTSRTLLPADILCIERTPSTPIDIPRYSQIHVFDYVGIDNSRFMRSLRDREEAHIIAPTDGRAQAQMRDAEIDGRQVHVLLPPVAVDLWTSSRFRKSLRAVHIGNFKPYYALGSDPYAERFLALIQQEGLSVWGRNWEDRIPTASQKGRASLLSVSHIYAQAHVALGMMYPFQRDITISGRFWHAPLNGCHVLSEPNSAADSIPGVVQTDYGAASASARISEVVEQGQPQAIAEQSREYWSENFRLAAASMASLTDPVRAQAMENTSAKESAYRRSIWKDGARVLAQKARLR